MIHEIRELSFQLIHSIYKLFSVLEYVYICCQVTLIYLNDINYDKFIFESQYIS